MVSIEDAAVIEAIGDVAALDRVLASGGNPDARAADGRSALEVAIESDDVASLRRLIAAGARVNAARPDGWTALHTAVDFESDCARQNGLRLDLRHVLPLLDAGADPAAEWTGGSTDHRTPIDIARSYEHVAAVEALERANGERR